MGRHPRQRLLGAAQGCSNAFPFLFFPAPSLHPFGKKALLRLSATLFWVPNTLFGAGLAVYPFTSSCALFATQGTAATLFFWLYCEGLHARGTSWRGYLTKSAGKRLKIQVAALKAFPLPVPFLSTDKVATITFVRYEFSLLKISCPLANRFRRTCIFVSPSGFFFFCWLFV